MSGSCTRAFPEMGPAKFPAVILCSMEFPDVQATEGGTAGENRLIEEKRRAKADRRTALSVNVQKEKEPPRASTLLHLPRGLLPSSRP